MEDTSAVKESLLQKRSRETHPVVAYVEARRRNAWKVNSNEKIYNLLKGLPRVNAFSFSNLYNIGSVSLKLSEGDISCGTVERPQIDKLLNASSPSPFGKGDQTVFDENIRKGKEIKAEDLILTPPKGHPSLQDFLEKEIGQDIQRALFPAATKLTFKFYKLAIYEEGGHFAFHRDTTHSSDHHGTLLIGLNTKFEGGALKLQDCKIAKWGGQGWCAFYTDVMHAVDPITSGVRAVLQFDILYTHSEKSRDFASTEKIQDKTMKDADDDSEASGDDEDEEEEEDEVDSTDENEKLTYRLEENLCQGENPSDSLDCQPDALNAIVDILKEKVTESEAIALPLSSLYRSQSILPEYLKRLDRGLFDAIVAAGFKVSFLSTAVEIEGNYDGNFDSVEEAFKVSPLSEPEVYYFLDDKTNAVKHVFLDTGKKAYESVTYMGCGAGCFLTVNETSYAEYTGNEAQPAEHSYFSGAMVIFK